MKIQQALLLVIVVFASKSVQAVSQLKLEFKLEQVASAEKFKRLLKYPPVLAMAMQNSGLSITSSGKLMAKDLQTVEMIRTKSFPFKSATLKYMRHSGDRYFYNLEVDWNLGVTTKKLAFDLAVDTSSLADKRVEVEFFSPWLKMVPAVFVKYVNDRASAFRQAAIQKKLFRYLNSTLGGANSKEDTGLLIPVLLGAYNYPTQGGKKIQRRYYGDADPDADQGLLIASVILWILGPAFWFWVVRIYRKRRSPVRVSGAEAAPTPTPT